MNRIALHFVALVASAWCVASASLADDLIVDFSKVRGSIRPLHGVNVGPLTYRGVVDLSEYHRLLDIPLTRLHDVPWSNYDAVDISIIFRDFRNDPNDTGSYDFASTDDYIAAIVANKSPILYRLGESIEHTPRKYRVNPPKDFEKWAEICCGIIRHYNEGWANGYKHNIRYWEIWNEPDNKPATWTGTDEQFLELYEVTAKAIKSRWPELKVGGPAFANAGRLKDNEFIPSPQARRFLGYCRDNQVPLDFFSWHRYTKDPSEYARHAHAVRRMLDEHGFTKTESHLNEWNYLPRGSWTSLTKGGQGLPRQEWLAEMSGPRGAAFDAWVLMSLQGAPVDITNFFTADTQMLGMFTDHGVPKKNFYAFKAFRALVDTPVRVDTPVCKRGQVAVCAGLSRDGQEASILLSNFDATDKHTTLLVQNVPWTEASRFEICLVDKDSDLKVVRRGLLDGRGSLPLTELRAPSVVLVKLKCDAAGE